MQGSPAPQTQQQQPNEQIDFTNFLQHANNPAIVFFTLLFKGLAIILFLVLDIFGVSQALIFILVVILSAFDFWFVKNVSGRILVGLRWWNEVKEDGSLVETNHYTGHWAWKVPEGQNHKLVPLAGNVKFKNVCLGPDIVPRATQQDPIAYPFQRL